MRLDQNIKNVAIKICSKCIYDERVPYISFDQNGICNYCHQVEELKKKFGTGTPKGARILNELINKIKKEGKNKKYNCVLGVSGGTDSSYLIHLVKKKWGLKPLAVHYDDTWNTAIASMNMKKVLDKCDVDLYTYVTDNKESCDIYRSFFLADVAELCASPDLAINFLLRKISAKYGIKYIFEGHSFIAEGITPLGRNYFDGKYIKSIHKMYGKYKMTSYPLMTLFKFLKSCIIDRPKFIRPFWYLQYSKTEAQKFLSKEYGWKDYKGHHLENRLSSFYHSVYNPNKFNIDLRNNTLSAKVRIGEISRRKAWKMYNTPPLVEEGLLNYFKKRLDLSDELYEKTMQKKPKSWKNYPTYKKIFEMLRPLFYLLAKSNLVPMSFYIKYCFPVEK